MLKAALSGGYVNFGVFNLYGDEALNNSLNMFVKLAYSIPRKDILVSRFLSVRQFAKDIVFSINNMQLQHYLLG